MQGWRAAWYPDLAKTSGLGMDMGLMTVAEGSTPFEQRFIEAMILHHEGALMAKDALPTRPVGSGASRTRDRQML